MLPDFGTTTPLATPLYPSSVYCIPDLDAIDAIYNGSPGYIYARDSHPNARILSEALNSLHQAKWGIVTGSGMGAISAVFLTLLSQGDHIVASNRLYGKSTKLLRAELQRFGVTSEFVDTCDLDAVRTALRNRPTRLLFLETMSNPMCRVCDMPALAEIAHEHGAQLYVDNTFATPVLCRPLELGADLVMESLTKLIGGHSDITLGYVGGKDLKQGESITFAMSTWGLSANPFDCWLTERGLSTLTLRAQAASDNAQKIAEALHGRSGVAQVVYPGLRHHPDHELARTLLPQGMGSMMCFELSGGREAVNRFLRKTTHRIPFAPSLGHATTTCSHPGTTSHRYETAESQQIQGITPGLIRLSVGCEPIGDILQSLELGLAAC